MPRLKASNHAAKEAVKAGTGGKDDAIYTFEGVPGLELRVSSSGAYWRARCERLRATIGHFPHMTFTAAVQKAIEVRSEMKTTGAQPVNTKATFAEVAAAYLKAIRRDRAPLTMVNKEHVLQGQPTESLRSVRLAALNFEDVRRTVEAWMKTDPGRGKRRGKKNRHAAGEKVRREILAMLEWALSRREYGVSFAQVAEIRRVKRPEGRFRREIVLHDPDMRVLWEHTDSLTSVNCALRFLLLTGQRTKEVRLARWSDIRDGVWYVSHRKGTTTKNPIPLSSLALAELDRARLFGSELLFPGRDGKALRDGQIRQRAYSIQKIAHMDKWAPHDLRRTLRSKLGDLGVNFAVAEKVLGHELPGEIANVYDVGTAIEPKREALERFADHVRRVLNPPGAPADPVPLALVA